MLKHVFNLFKLPIDDQTVFIPFSGAGSEIISVLSVGIKEENIVACELSSDFITIAKNRIKFWIENKFFFKEDKKVQDTIKKDLKKTKSKKLKEILDKPKLNLF